MYLRQWDIIEWMRKHFNQFNVIESSIYISVMKTNGYT